ncbi:hypothetical protein Fleli_1076 [Bernardetia litoralis DSM 6794]|uniref:DUF6438 domain-containing protein n=1 Tax=Bernardetia litoralis (strain ATCC 23117 / DSM 6794 / NBRC 15988 / NCIMB 1366 / Fx l1 / Sio-4) TaxID=880071 RepID=I4AHS9_BERLS|nr:DUF6438 domain-containing protein [Bernardetia litoralis]AFM03514.1 hypothetical protein Fleli_1076 [Bernardetia litoralis DSM 6794]
MKNHFLLFALFSSLLLCSSLFFSCKPAKTESFFELKYAKTACKGRCPVFDLTIKEDQMVIFNGRQYTTIVGIVQIKLSDEKFQILQNLIEESQFLETDPIGYNRPFDIPMTTLEISKGQKHKKQITYLEKPQNIEPILAFLDMLVIELQADSK